MFGNQARFRQIASAYMELSLLNGVDFQELLSVFDEDNPLSALLQRCESVHAHVKVDDTARLPRQEILALGATPESEQPGYTKFKHDCGLNMIFSSIDVAIEDLIPDFPRHPKPFLDHVGFDLRLETPETRALFDEVPRIGRSLQWSHVPQGGKEAPVYCCHTEVKAKHWLFPRQTTRWTRPIEIAYGELTLHGEKMGCDLRPIDPLSPFADRAPSCITNEAPIPPSYYDPRDLRRFSEMGRFAPDLMSKFDSYYKAATQTDGALTAREKALIALAVAHAKKCPYCIEAYTHQSLATGSTPEQMHEAVHVAAALSAGIDLVHGVQMQNVLRGAGAIS